MADQFRDALGRFAIENPEITTTIQRTGIDMGKLAYGTIIGATIYMGGNDKMEREKKNEKIGEMMITHARRDAIRAMDDNELAEMDELIEAFEQQDEAEHQMQGFDLDKIVDRTDPHRGKFQKKNPSMARYIRKKSNYRRSYPKRGRRKTYRRSRNRKIKWRFPRRAKRYNYRYKYQY